MNSTRLLTLTTIGALLTGVALWSLTSQSLAAEADAEPTPTAGTEDGDDEAPSGNPSGEVFIPTEEISEDFAVSFPVDI